MKIGDSVVVKPGVKDPDLGSDIGGWRGRVSAIDGDIICIDWDSFTLEQMAGADISQCEERGLDWKRISLEVNEVEVTAPRDTEEDVRRSIAMLKKEHAWDYLGEDREIIQEVLGNVELEDEWDELTTWGDFLKKRIKFPFEGEITEYQERGPLQSGDRVIVQGIEDVDEWYGVIVKLRRGRTKYYFPLCDIDAVDKGSENYRIIRGYAVWFANR